MKKIMRFSLVFLFALSILYLNGVEGKDKKNTGNSKKEIPIKSIEAKKEKFVKDNIYYAVVRGIKESFAGSFFDGKVEKIKVKVGDKVRKDQVLMTFPKDEPKAQYFQAKVCYENSKAQYERIQKLYKSGGISLQQRDNVYTKFKVDKANWDIVRKGVNIKSPISGIITELHVRESDNVKKKQVLVTVAKTDKLRAIIWVSGKDINSIKKGDKAVAKWNGNSIDGEVISVAAAMNMKKMAFRVDVEFENKDLKIKPGVTAEITLSSKADSLAFVVTRLAVFQKDNDYYVYVNDNNIAKKKKVELGRSRQLDIEITKGLQEGDKVIVEGVNMINDNDKIYEVN